ncbi:MAG: AfsR/SARP family transcriptional regulator [Oscillochloridaceae bacterium umkhey_bin13]
MPHVCLALLGPPEIICDPAPVRLDRQKAVALLAYLALTGRRHGREALADLLWPDLPAERSAAALRQAVWALNTALGAGTVASDRNGIALGSTVILDLDVAAFRAHLASARAHPGQAAPLQAAVALYRGDLLAGLDLRDSAPFAEWHFFEAEALRQEFALALDDLVTIHEAQADYAEAASLARRRVTLDPLHEPSHRALMRSYAALGQRSAALRQYEECARILAEELGSEPDEATRRLHVAIRAGTIQQAQAALAGPRLNLPAPAAAQAAVTPNTAQAFQAEQEGMPTPLVGAAAAAAVQVGGQPPVTLRLPSPATPFVGRSDELAQITALLADPACRLLTLLGPGGIGKTRLAIAAAQQVAPTFADGVAFVALAPVRDPDLIHAAIADAIGLDLFRRERVSDLLYDYLRPRTMLLVLDNLEQLANGASQIEELLEAAPQLRVMLTSRERLGLLGEWPLAVTGLALPADPAAARKADAVQLFLHGVRRATGGRDMNEAEMTTVVRICRLLAGTPLAIELAASWSRIMPLEQIAQAIAQDLDFLGDGARGLPERHRGLRAVFTHSWQLLSPTHQQAFCQLAVFCGGFTRAAAAAVLATTVPEPILAALVDRSLLRLTGAGRYDLHELLRQYATEQLTAAPQAHAAARAAHARYYLELLRRQEANLKGAGQPEALATLAADLDNLRMAWGHALGTGQWALLAQALESLFLFYELASLHEEGEDSFGRAATALANQSDPDGLMQIVLINLLARWGWFALRLYRFETARAILRWSLELSERLGSRRETAFAELLANAQVATGGQVVSAERLRAQVEHLRASGDRWSLAFALNTLAHAAPTALEAEALFSESLALCRLIGDQRGIASNLDALAELAGMRAELDRAIQLWEEVLDLYRTMGYRWAYAFSLDKQGYALRRKGALARAEQRHRESLAASRAIGDRLGVAGSLDNLGLVALDAGRLNEAEAWLREGLALRLEVGHQGSLAVSYLSMALLHEARGAWADCAAALDAAVQADPDSDWLVIRSLRIRARLALRNQDPATAQDLLHQAQGLITNELHGYEAAATGAVLAAVLLAKGDQAEAARLAQAALRDGGQVMRVRHQAEAVLAQIG